MERKEREGSGGERERERTSYQRQPERTQSNSTKLIHYVDLKYAHLLD